MRRILVGRNKEFGLYYSIVGKRLVVSALFNLRQDPQRISEILRDRGILE